MQIIVPDVYIEFLAHNRQRIFNDGVLYDYDEILEKFETLEFSEYASNYIPIGNDNGDYELVMKAEKDEILFGVIDQGAIGAAEPELWQNFIQWYENGAKFIFDSSKKNSNPKVRVYIKALPDDNREKILMQIKKALVIDMPTSELLKLADTIPCVITEKYYKGQIDVLIKKHKLEEWIAYK